MLPTAFVSCYVLLLTWSALTSIPSECKILFLFEYCFKFLKYEFKYKDTFLDYKNSSIGHLNWCSSDMQIVALDRKFIAYLTVLVSILITIYTSLKTSSESTTLGIEINKPTIDLKPKKTKKSSLCCCFDCCTSKKPSKFKIFVNYPIKKT